ncbi:bifunctional hydroxymethylpyrimidine kinase/phosphomethylpyrimidine kinase [Anoxybacillus sp. CHMUD]|uniref:bifunctional hydroxymethylpyrimidine kinase/phosphomethylpyrimidine kinase n=1 Tax=Anoxybacillus sp. CHMUD TaxID=2508870 RepID=UPI0014931A32|nr:bifunctional hydroxymethylpyrimidine kinase/phosphomethylpyrimidine kinase [Anoxybacillus sp. CHMUD]NNU89656.1 bifunctional hydroxymethylpyrimidine kinase/phosphomethylpyrimidine kinase [Anoxybacillus sp. CHMUD]
MVYKALTIAGSDSGGGAGIQADLKTFHQFRVFGMSAITAVTAQNTLGVQGVYPLPIEAIEKQIDSIAVDLPPDAVKTGMLFNEEIIELVARKIKQYGWVRVVVDPVMIAKGGAPLLKQEAVKALQHHMLPLAHVLTPNIPEAEVLTNMRIETLEQRKEAAKKLHDMGVQYVVMKGGHGKGDELVDLLYDGEQFYEWTSQKIYTKHTHGTGCTFAAAITAQLAKGKTAYEAVDIAKRFIQKAIEQTLQIGSGHGPTNHWAFHE